MSNTYLLKTSPGISSEHKMTVLELTTLESFLALQSLLTEITYRVGKTKGFEVPQ